MKRILAGLGLGVFCFGLAWFPAGVQAEKKSTATQAAKAASAEKIDITAEWQTFNSNKYQAPPGQFRAGHIEVRQLDPKAITKTKDGFTIQLPSRAPVATPTVYDGKVFVSGGFHSKEFYCFDAVTGQLVWAVDLDDDGPSSAVCQDGVVVFNTESCTIFALDARTGKLLWSYWLGDPLTSTPAIANGKVFTSYPAMGRQQVGANVPKGKADGKAGNGGQAAQKPPATHVLACFDLKTGKILWQRWIDSDVMSAPVAVDREVFVTSFGGNVYKFKQDDGAILSTRRMRATSAPVIVGANVYLTQRADDGKGPASEKNAGFGRETNQLAWEGKAREAKYLDVRVQGKTSLKQQALSLDAANGFVGGAPPAANAMAAGFNIGQTNVSTMQAFQGSRVLNYKDNNFNCMGDELVCTDPSNGKARWSLKLKGDLAKQGGHLGAPPAAAGGMVFLSTLEGRVLQIDPRAGKVLKSYSAGSAVRAQPAIMNGRIYVGTTDGKLVCIDTGNRSFTGWSTWGGNAGHTNVAE
jgi:outer membrane protein assembly factor BamB